MHHGESSASLRTRRLLLTPVGEDDLEELFALHSDPRAFADDLTDPLTDREQMRRVLQVWQRGWRQHGVGYFTVRAAAGAEAYRAAELPPGLLGVVGLTPLEVGTTMPLSAYWRLAPDVQGCGVASEAMRAVLSHLGAGREVVAVTAARNQRSRALAARLGFVPADPHRPVPGGRDGDVLLERPAYTAPS